MSSNSTTALGWIREWSSPLVEWRYDPDSSRRDLRLDLLRGLFLCVMLIFHFHRSWLIHYTHEFLGTVTAAEGFVFISGMVVCLVYFPIYRRNGFKAMSRKVWTRALRIYLADIVLLTGFVLFDRFVLPLRPITNIPDVSPFELVIDIVTLRYLPFGFDILLLYLLLLAATPLMLWLVHSGRTAWLVAGSLALYLLYYLSPATFEWHFVSKEIWRFPFMVWQVIFVAGILIAEYRPELGALWARLPHRLPQIVVLGLFVSFFALRQMLDHGGMVIEPSAYDFWFSKSMLGPGRLLNFAILGLVLYWLVDRFWEPLVRAPGKLFIPLGQAALYVYLLHLILAYAYRSGLAERLPYLNSGLYEIFAILSLWFLVRRQFLFSIVPH